MSEGRIFVLQFELDVVPILKAAFYKKLPASNNLVVKNTSEHLPNALIFISSGIYHEPYFGEIIEKNLLFNMFYQKNCVPFEKIDC